MAKALILIGQGMHGRRVSVASIEDRGFAVVRGEVTVELGHARSGVSIWVNGDYIETSADPEVIAGAVIAHLVHDG